VRLQASENMGRYTQGGYGITTAKRYVA